MKILIHASIALTLSLALMTVLPLYLYAADATMQHSLITGVSTNQPMHESAIATHNTASSTITQSNPDSNVDPKTLIDIDITPIPLTSKLQRSYVAYNVSVSSRYPVLLRLYSANINNGVAGYAAFESCRAVGNWHADYVGKKRSE